jgi:hypothetical protein
MWRYLTFRLWLILAALWMTPITILYGLMLTRENIFPRNSDVIWLPVVILAPPLVLLIPCWLAMWSSDRAKGIDPPFRPARWMPWALAGAAIVFIGLGVISHRMWEQEKTQTLYFLAPAPEGSE